MGALKWNTQATTAKARGRQEPEVNLFDARGKPCKQKWLNLPTGQAGAKANANR